MNVVIYVGLWTLLGHFRVFCDVSRLQVLLIDNNEKVVTSFGTPVKTSRVGMKKWTTKVIQWSRRDEESFWWGPDQGTGDEIRVPVVGE